MRRIRGQRRKGRPLVITPRDVDTVTLVTVCGYASVEQLAREFFAGNTDNCRKRLRRLFDAGFLDVHILSSNQPALVTIARDGIALLRDQAPHVVTHARPRTAIKLAGVPHHLALVDARCWLAALAEARGATHFAWGNPGGPLHTASGLLETFGLIPDGLADLSVPLIATADGSNTSMGYTTTADTSATSSNPDSLYRYAIEVDCGTESVDAASPSSIMKKLAKYAAAFEDDCLDGLLLLVATDARVGRQEQLRTAVLRAGIAERSVLLAHADVVRRPVAPPPVPRAPERAGVRESGAGEGRRASSPTIPLHPSPQEPQRNATATYRNPVADRMADRRADRRPDGTGGH